MSPAENGQRRLPEGLRFYSVAEVAEILNVGRKAVRKLVHDRKLIALRPGNALRIPEASLVSFLEASLFTGPATGERRTPSEKERES